MSSARTEAIFRVLPPDVQAEMAPLRHVLGSRMLLTDPPEHTRLKNLVMKAFSASATNTRRERITEICDELLDRVVERGELDVMRDLATQAPSWVIADLLGVPRDEQGTFARWAHDQVRVYDRPGTTHDRVAVMRQGQASMLEMKAYLEEIIAARRVEPRDDLITQLVQAEEQGDRLTTDEMVIMVVAILVGGNNSTAHAIGNAVLTLLRQPAAVEQLRADPGLIRTAFEEVLRFESPVQSTSRVASEALELHGQTLGARDNVHLLIGSANRDEAQFPDPTRYDPTRQPNRHLTFAHGPHFCLGTSVAPRHRADRGRHVATPLRRPGTGVRRPGLEPGFLVPECEDATGAVRVCVICAAISADAIVLRCRAPVRRLSHRCHDTDRVASRSDANFLKAVEDRVNTHSHHRGRETHADRLSVHGWRVCASDVRGRIGEFLARRLG